MLQNFAKRVTVLLPSLNPDEKLRKTVDDLLYVGFNDIVIVNDGSREDCIDYFPMANEHITLLTHEVNRGKGAALKTALRYVLDNRPDSLGVVTVDGDGQHAAADVRRCAEEMLQSDRIVFGCRDFSLPQVPRRSRMGNRITASVFHLFCGLKLSDTQTGLRAFPATYLPLLLKVPGDRFEYETNMLYEIKAQEIPYCEVKIETVYIEDNRTSHFRPVRDSLRVYARFILFILASFSSFVVDVLLFALLLKLAEAVFSVNFSFDNLRAVVATAICKACARIFSALFNYTLNRKKVFASSEAVGKTMLRYFALAACIMLVSSGVTAIAKLLLHVGGAFCIALLGIAVDLALFVVSFRFQQNWVFKK